MTSKTRHRNEPDYVGRGKAAALVYPQKLVEWTALVGRTNIGRNRRAQNEIPAGERWGYSIAV